LIDKLRKWMEGENEIKFNEHWIVNDG